MAGPLLSAARTAVLAVQHAAAPPPTAAAEGEAGGESAAPGVVASAGLEGPGDAPSMMAALAREWGRRESSVCA